jgi:glycosyltransferase involved in cell wall biosynthesis
MRLAFLTQSYPPMVSGAALVVQRLAQGLANRGHAVLVIAASDRGAAYVEEYGRLRVARLRAYRNPFRVGQHFLLWPERELANELARFQPQIIHSHDPLVLSLALLRAFPKYRKDRRGLEDRVGLPPKILTVHQLPWFISLFAPRPLRRPIESLLWHYGRWLYRHFDSIIAPSQMIADLVTAHTHQPTKTITNGVDTVRFTPESTAADESVSLRQKYNLDPHLPIILYAGRIDIDKRVDLVVRAAAKTLQTESAQLLVIGDGKLRKQMIELSRTLGVDHLCHFPGFVSDDLAGLYRLASVFITASEVEIQSSVVLEAMASGLPVVTVQASSMPEFVRDGVTGYLVRPGDVNALAERLIVVLQDLERARLMGRAGLDVARQHSNERALIEHEHLYESSIAGL